MANSFPCARGPARIAGACALVLLCYSPNVLAHNQGHTGGAQHGGGSHNGSHNGNGNVGAFNGNGNGNGNAGSYNGNHNGNGNHGLGNGNGNGNGNSGHRNGDRNGNRNWGALNGNLNGNFNGSNRGVREHVSFQSGAISLHESLRVRPNGSIFGRFTFQDGSVTASGFFRHSADTWSVSFKTNGIPGITRLVMTDGSLGQASFNGCYECGGVGNVGAFEGLGNASPTSGNYNVGVFNGDFNGGSFNGNHNVGVFNGNFNGLGYSPSSTSGSFNGNGNTGFFNGNFNGNAAGRARVNLVSSAGQASGPSIASSVVRPIVLSSLTCGRRSVLEERRGPGGSSTPPWRLICARF